MKPTNETYSPLILLGKELDRLFNMPAFRDLEDTTIATSAWTPAVDIREETERFLIRADIPGVVPEAIEVTMEGGVLTIKGERVEEHTEESEGYRRAERRLGSFHRRFSLPDTADADTITASGKDGVLEIVIPKKTVAQPRKIEVMH